MTIIYKNLCEIIFFGGWVMLLWFFDLGSKLSKAHIQPNVLLMIIQMKNSVAFKIIAVNSFFPISFLITENLAELFENTSIRKHTAVV